MTATPNTSQFCFAGPDLEICDISHAKTVIGQLPYDATTSYRPGTRDGPRTIIQASSQLELFDEELLYQPAMVGIATLEPLEPNVEGPEHMVKSVRDYCLPIVETGKYLICLGGEHTVSVGCLEAQIAWAGSDISVLHLDAHADLRDSYQQSRYSHACVVSRMLEKCHVVSAGIRSFSAEEFETMQSTNFAPFSMRTIRSNPDWIDQIIARLGPKVYITLDLDCMDPGICPGVGTPEPGGFSWYEITGLLRAVFAQREVVGADLVECLPLAGQHITEFLAARLVYKLIGYRFASEYGPSSIRS